jgi:molybdopterin-guanine dinucleotide biosynthesis protein A
MNTAKTTAIILAGGKSSRFGGDKTILPLGNRLLIHHLVEACNKFADEVLIIGNQQNKFAIEGVREISDIFKEMGPLGGFHAEMRIFYPI